MPPITWRNINLPGFGSAAQLAQSGSGQVTKGIDRLTGVASGIQKDYLAQQAWEAGAADRAIAEQNKGFAREQELIGQAATIANRGSIVDAANFKRSQQPVSQQNILNTQADADYARNLELGNRGFQEGRAAFGRGKTLEEEATYAELAPVRESATDLAVRAAGEPQLTDLEKSELALKQGDAAKAIKIQSEANDRRYQTVMDANPVDPALTAEQNATKWDKVVSYAQSNLGENSWIPDLGDGGSNVGGEPLLRALTGIREMRFLIDPVTKETRPANDAELAEGLGKQARPWQILQALKAASQLDKDSWGAPQANLNRLTQLVGNAAVDTSIARKKKARADARNLLDKQKEAELATSIQERDKLTFAAQIAAQAASRG